MKIYQVQWIENREGFDQFNHFRTRAEARAFATKVKRAARNGDPVSYMLTRDFEVPRDKAGVIAFLDRELNTHGPQEPDC